MSKITSNQTKTISIGLVISILIVVLSFGVFYFNPLNIDTNLYKVLILLFSLAVAGFIFFKSPNGFKFSNFLQEIKIELKKVVWPNKDDTVKTTGLIILAVIIIAIFLLIIDSFFTWIVQLLTTD
jgi:preprotein translocase subunit SecE